jgi:UDP-N-acetylmuramoyl-L-alanyl-D-glutamate--2,6-diaminopimelate ligase
MLLSKLASKLLWRGTDVAVQGICSDSRKVQTGFLFAALAGEKADGQAFIQDALAKGAVAILAASGKDIPYAKPAIIDAEPRKALAKIAATFYAQQPEMIAAVTGTSGKTSTVQFLRQLWQVCGHRAASIGTLGVIGTDIERYGSLTTPDSIALHQDLEMLVRKLNITHLAMEASSHGLDQYRLDGVRVKLAAFTNFSRDHLDYHPSMEEYFKAKQRLFTEILPFDGVAVLNADSPECAALKTSATRRRIKIITYGESDHADIRLLEKIYAGGGQDLKILHAGKEYATRINLVGAFQAYNVLCALALAVASGEDIEKLIALVPQLQGVRGRLEYVGEKNGGHVYVDYAHKPDALENVLQALRPHTENRLITVFGCGGNRDAGKRPIMGAIAAKLSDRVIVTDDNPRHEDAATIRKEVLQGCPEALEIPDRGEAITHALSLMQKGDSVLIAGKGHETGQIIGDTTLPFDDAEIARKVLR